MYRQLLLGQPVGNQPMPDGVLAAVGPLMILLGAALPVLFYKMALVTEVLPDGIDVRFIPLARQFIPFGNIALCEVREYRPILEYGGWGIRYGFSGKAYNVSGNRGVQLTFTTGKRFLIGSQQPEQLAAAILEGMRASCESPASSGDMSGSRRAGFFRPGKRSVSPDPGN